MASAKKALTDEYGEEAANTIIKKLKDSKNKNADADLETEFTKILSEESLSEPTTGVGGLSISTT